MVFLILHPWPRTCQHLLQVYSNLCFPTPVYFSWVMGFMILPSFILGNSSSAFVVPGSNLRPSLLIYYLDRFSRPPLCKISHNFICSVTPHRNESAIWSVPPTSCQIHCHPALTRHPSKRQTYHRTGRADTKTTLKFSPVPPFCNQRSNKTRYAYKRWNLSFTRRQGWGLLWTSKIFLSLLIILKAEAWGKEGIKEAESRRQSCWRQTSILVLSTSFMLLWNRFFHNSIVIGHMSSVAPWSLRSTLQTLHSCPHQPDEPTSHPKCVFHSSFQLYYLLGIAPHPFTCSSLEFSTIQSWPCGHIHAV